MSMLKNPFLRSGDGALICNAPSQVKQSFKDSCDINKIVKQYRTKGVLTHLASSVPIYADVSEVPDYQTALSIVGRASELFNALPALAREKFDNDPEKMVEWLRDPKNVDEGIKLGLLKKKDNGPTNPPPSPPPAGSPPGGPPPPTGK